jgi:hypothetical protein
MTVSQRQIEEVLPETVSARKIGRLEHFLGPENYRIIRGLLTTPASIAGFIIIALFLLTAALAPVIAPPKSVRDPYKIPRNGCI